MEGYGNRSPHLTDRITHDGWKENNTLMPHTFIAKLLKTWQGGITFVFSKWSNQNIQHISTDVAKWASCVNYATFFQRTRRYFATFITTFISRIKFDVCIKTLDIEIKLMLHGPNNCVSVAHVRFMRFQGKHSGSRPPWTPRVTQTSSFFTFPLQNYTKINKQKKSKNKNRNYLNWAGHKCTAPIFALFYYHTWIWHLHYFGFIL